MFKRIKLSYLSFLAKQAPEILIQKLSEPILIDWERDSRSESEKMLDTIRYKVHPESYDRFLLCSALPATSPAPDWFRDLVNRRVDVDRYLPGWTMQRSRDTRWTVASFPAVLGQVGATCHLIIGACPGKHLEIVFPWGIDRIMGKESIGQIRTGIHAALKNSDRSCFSFFVLPMFSYPEGPGISGKSHGLSVAIAVTSLIFQKSVPDDLLATGQVDENGKVLPVAALDIKIAIATRRGFTVFLFPKQRAPEASGRAFPVESVDDAWLIA